jgi:TPR repeat protein
MSVVRRLLFGVAAYAVTGVLLSGQSATDLAAAIQAYERGDAARAFQLLRPLAAAGEGRAEYYLGTLYRDGRGTSRDLVQAYVQFNRSGSKAHELAERARAARDDVETRLSPDELARAQTLSEPGAAPVELTKPTVSDTDRTACQQLFTIAGLVARQSMPTTAPPLEWGRTKAIVLFDRSYSDKRVEATVVLEHTQVVAVTELMRSCALVEHPGAKLTLFDKDDYFHVMFGSTVVRGAVDTLYPVYVRPLQRWVRVGAEVRLELD